MEIITTSLEALIQRATNINNHGPDTAAIDAYCGLINKEPQSAQIAAKFITSKVHSLHEWEALQALLVLEACMRRCGAVFHAEVGKFRFLNELIKLVSPKYMGEHTPEPVRNRVLELMYTWTLQYPRETKIKEAYDMLKKQGVVKEDPPLSIRESSIKDQPSILQDQEKSLLLQRLLQSKNPNDLQAANRLIKSMVKEDERKMEEKWRHAVELETAVNNCRLLKEMLENWDPKNGRTEDLDLIKELHTACLNLSPVLHRLASTSPDPSFCQSVISANEELSEVFARYNAVMKSPNEVVKDSVSSLLDLTPVTSTSNSIEDASNNLASVCLEQSRESPALRLASNGENTSIPAQPNLLDDIFGIPPPPVSEIFMTSKPSAVSSVLCIEKVPSKENTKSKGFEELDLLGKSLLQENLLLSKNAQNNKPHKVSLNEMYMQSTVNDVIPESNCSSSNNLIDADLLGLEEELKDSEPLELDSRSSIVEEGKTANVPPPAASPSPSVKSDKKIEINPQILPLGDIKVSLDTVKPSSVPPFNALEEKNGISIAIFLAKDRPRPDVSVYVVTTSSKNEFPLENFLFQPVVPKCCRLRLLPPSSTTLPPHNPFLPPSAITQIMLIAAPNKAPIVLKFVVSYTMEEETITELGEITDLPLIE